MARDRDVLNAMAGLLAATNLFDAVVLHRRPESCEVGADRSAVATLRRVSARRVQVCDSPPTLLRTVTYELAVAYRDDDPAVRAEALERLENACTQQLEGVSLGGITLPRLTTLGEWADDPKARHPEQRTILKGKFAYLFDQFGTADTTP